MDKAKVIPIAKARGKKTNFILVTKFDNPNVNSGRTQYYHYQLTELLPINKSCDIGVWRKKKVVY